MNRSPLIGLVLALGATLSGCDAGTADEDRPHKVVAGEMIEAAGVSPEVGDEHVVMLPSGKVTFTVTDPIRHVDFTDTTRTDDLEPADGVDLVGISWEHERYVYARDVGEALAGNFQVDKTQKVGLSIVADDKSYDFPDIGTAAEPGGADNFHVGLARAASELALEVEYDGLVQAVDLRTGVVDQGAAAPLYRAELAGGAEPDEQSASCPSVDRDGGRLRWYFFCQVERAIAVPYVPGQGWAADGRTFVVAWAFASVGGVDWILDDNHYASYSAKPRQLRTTLDGAASVTAIEAKQMSSSAEWLVFDVPVAKAHRMRFAGGYVAKPTAVHGTGGQHPRQLVLEVDESVRLADPTF